MDTDDLVNLLNIWTTWQYAQSLSVRTVVERTRTVTRMATECRIPAEKAGVEHLAAWLSNPSWTASSRWTYHQQLGAWFLWLQKQGHRVDNPMILIGKPRKPKGEPHPVTDREMAKILRTTMRRRSRAMILLAALAGLRAHEIAKVHAEHLDLIERTIRVVGKGNVDKTLPLHHLLVEHAYQMPRKGPWFPGSDNGCQRRESICTTIKDVMVRANVKGSAHSLRHWFGTTLVDEGVDLRTAQELLRHSSLATTQIYTLVSPGKRLDGIDRLDPYRATNRPQT